jgi:hypothetical protein
MTDSTKSQQGSQAACGTRVADPYFMKFADPYFMKFININANVKACNELSGYKDLIISQ